MRYYYQTSEIQQEKEQTPVQSEKGDMEDDNTPVESQIVGYNASQDQYVLQSAGEIKPVDSSELFQTVADGEKIFVEGVKDVIPGFSITYQENDDMFIKEDSNLFVHHITVDEFKKELDNIY